MEIIREIYLHLFPWQTLYSMSPYTSIPEYESPDLNEDRWQNPYHAEKLPAQETCFRLLGFEFSPLLLRRIHSRQAVLT
jgi:hypothetical protein